MTVCCSTSMLFSIPDKGTLSKKTLEHTTIFKLHLTTNGQLSLNVASVFEQYITACGLIR